MHSHKRSRGSCIAAGLYIRIIMVFAIAAFSSLAALGQGISGRIVGRVVDPTGAVIPKAMITATNVDTGIVTKTITNSVGEYVLNNLDPGRYTVQALASGFSKTVSTENVVTVNSATVVNFTLELGSTSATVHVTGGRPVLNLTTPAMSETIDSKMLKALPLIGGIFSQAMFTVPGVLVGPQSGWGSAPESASGAGSITGIQAGVNGMGWTSTEFTLDGVSDMEYMNSFINVVPPLDSIEEVKISTNNASPSVGDYGGAQVNAITRSGANRIFGSVYEYYRGESLAALPWVNKGPLTQVPAPTRTPFHGNQFGGSLGGPIIKNKLFYFGAYQAIRDQYTDFGVFSVPPSLVREGVFTEGASGMYFEPIYIPNSYDPTTGLAKPWGYSRGTDLTAAGMPAGAYIGGCPSNAPPDSQCIPQADWDPVAKQIVNNYDFWPQAINNNSRINNYSSTITQPSDTQKIVVKADYQLNANNHISARDLFQWRDLQQPGYTQFLGEGVDSAPRDTNALIAWDHTLSPTATNQFRLSFSRFFTYDHTPDEGTNENNKLGIPNGNQNIQGGQAFANMYIGEYSSLGDPNGWSNAHRIDNIYELDDDFMKVHDRQTLEFGGQLRRLVLSLSNGNYPGSGQMGFGADMTSGCAGSGNGTCVSYAGSGFASFLLGLPDWMNQGADLYSPNNVAWMWGAYGTDTFRMTPHLTLTAALRWDVITNPIETHNRQTNFDPNTGLLVLAHHGNRHPNVDNYYGGILPNVGFAYAFNNNKTVIRGGFGMTQFTSPFGGMAGYLEENYPWFDQITASEQEANTPWRSLGLNNPYVPAGANGLFKISAPQIPHSYTLVAPSNTYVKYMSKNYRPNQEYDWNFGIGQQITKTTSFSIRYVATRGLHLTRNFSINAITPGGSYQYPFGTLDPQLPDAINEEKSDGFSIWNSLQMELRKNFSHGLQGRVSYTWSKEKDDEDTWDPYNNAVDTGGASDFPLDIVGNILYQLPFGKDGLLFHSVPRAVNALIGGWQTSAIVNVQSGSPLQFFASYDALQTNYQISDWANKTCASVPQIGSVNEWFDTKCYADPALDKIGTAGFNSARAPRYQNTDMSLQKVTALGSARRMHLILMLTAANVFNSPHYGSPDTSIYDKLNPSGLGTYEFGTISGANSYARTMQVSAHFEF